MCPQASEPDIARSFHGGDARDGAVHVSNDLVEKTGGKSFLGRKYPQL